MRFVSPSILCLVLVVLTAGPARAQEPVADRVPVPLSDPGRPVTLKVHLIEGGITVKGSDTKEVIVEARPRVSRRKRRSRRPSKSSGGRSTSNTRATRTPSRRASSATRWAA